MSKVKKEYLDVFSSSGQLLYGTSSGSSVTNATLSIGNAGQVLTVVGSSINWSTPYQDPLTTTGDLLIYNSGTTRLPVGSNGYVLSVVSGVPAWTTPPSTYTNPLTTNGDLLIYDNGTTRLPIGTSNQVLAVVSGIPTWTSSVSSSDSAANTGSVGTGIFANKTSGTFNFYKLNPGSSLTTISLISSDHINIDIVPGNINTSTLNNDAGWISSLSSFTTDGLSQGTTHLYWSQTLFDTAFGAKNIGSLANVYTPTLNSSVDGYVLVYSNANSRFQMANFPPNSSNQIVDSAGTTSVKTAEVAGQITFDSNGKRVVNLLSTAGATNGEAFNFTNTTGQVMLTSSDSSGTNNVDMVFIAQANGAITFGASGTATMSSDAGSNMIIQPGTATSGNGATNTISGGSSSASGSSGGNLILQPGSGVSSNGQVVVQSPYTPTDSYSITTKTYVDTSRSTFTINLNTNTPYTALSTDQIIVQKLSSNNTSVVNLPQGSSVTSGKYYIIKDGKGNAASYNITIQPYSGDTIDGASSISIALNYESVMLVWNTSEWSIV